MTVILKIVLSLYVSRKSSDFDEIWCADSNFGSKNGHVLIYTRSSADADNRLDAFSGQSRSTNMVPFHMLHIVSYCAI